MQLAEYKKVYTEPKIKIYEDFSKGWYVWFRYNGKLIKVSAGYNRIKNYNERLRSFKSVQKSLSIKLKQGWNPLTGDIVHRVETMTLLKAIDFAMDKKRPQVTSKTYSGYATTARLTKEAIKRLGLQSLPITEAKRAHIKAIMEHLYEKRKWTNKSYNKHVGLLHAVLSELIQWDIIALNPAHDIKPLKTPFTTANIPATDEQLQQIKTEIKRVDLNFWEYLLMIFHAGIRPVEITQLKVKMINSKTQLITLPPDITKTARERVIPINPHLWKVIEPRLQYNDEYYLFGTFSPPHGNKKNYQNFIPGPNKISRDFATRRWETIVKKGMGLNVTMYSMKKAGANSKILAGMSIRSLKELFGHTSEVTTEIYITNLKAHIHKEIVEKSPDL